jgi:hypothetical protein
MVMDVNELLLAVSGISATLIGTFIVGVFFYIDTDLHRLLMTTDAADRYLRSGVRWVIMVYALPFFVTLTLAALEPIWGAATFIALGGMLLLSTVDTGRRILMGGRSGVSRALVVNQWVSTAGVVVLVSLPWIIGGWVPPATAFIPSILIALGVGFTSTAALIMTVFDATAAMGPPNDEPDVDQR